MADTPLQHDRNRFSNEGLQLRLPLGLVPSTQYSRYNNVLLFIIGQLETRPGLTLVFTFSTELELLLADDGGANWSDSLTLERWLTLTDDGGSNWADAVATGLAP